MRVLLTSHGSTGDIYPKIRLGKALKDAGHDVRYATVSLFREEIESAGLTYVYLPPDWDQAGFAEAMRDLTHARNNLELLQTIYRESVPFLDEVLERLDAELASADLFVSSYLFTHLGVLAERRGIPFAVTTFAHNVVPSPGYPPHGMPRLLGMPAKLRRGWNRAWWWLADRAIVIAINRVVGPVLDRHNLKRVNSFLTAPFGINLISVSPGLFEPANYDRERMHFVGYLRWQSAENPELDAEIRAFTEGQPVPILNFGSVTFDEVRHIMHRFLANWPRGKKLIVQAGWAGLTVERPRPEIKVIGKVSHDQLFKHASVVIHHGGAGTTGSVLHAGIPQIIIPHIADQPFFAAEMERVGVGRTLKRRKWPENLPTLVAKVERSKPLARRAREVAVLLRQEDGPGNAVRLLENWGRSGTVGT
ncbi:MAG: glycosyltransferase [Opitutales bacterium]